MTLSKNGNGDLQLGHGIFVDIFKELSRSLNFSYTVSSPPDGEWGGIQSDGSWSGMVGQLATKSVDFGMHIFVFPQPVINFPSLVCLLYPEYVST